MVKEINELTEIAKSILSETKSQGADHAQVLVFENENIGTRYGENHITQNSRTSVLNFSLQTQIGDKMGNYSGSAAALKKIPRMVRDAISLVKYSAPDPEFPGFIESQPTYPDLQREINYYEPDDIADVIRIGIDNALNVHSNIKSVAGSINYKMGRNVFANTNNVFADSSFSNLSGVINVAAQFSENESRSSDLISGVGFNDIKIDEISVEVANRALKGLDQQDLDIGSYESILDHNAVMELMWFFNLASSSSMLINQQSPFKDKLGEQVFDRRFNISDNTEDPTHFSAQEFDFDGVPSRSINYIEDGIVKDFAYDRRNSKKLGVENNGRSVGGLALFRASSIKPDDKSKEELISSIDKGVLITNIWYSTFVNMPEGSFSGLTKDGLFLIENGEVTSSLKNMRISDTLFSIFKEAEPGNEIKSKLHSIYGNIYGVASKHPPIKVGALNFSSKGKH